MNKIIFICFLFVTQTYSQVYLSNNWVLFNRDNSQLTSNRIAKINSLNDEYWFITYSEYVDSLTQYPGALHQFRNNNWKIFNSTNSPLDLNIVNDIAFSIDGKILIATSRGLYIKDGESWDSVNTGNAPLPDNFIYRVTVDKLNRYWLGIPNYGVSVFDNGNWTIYNYQNSFPGIEDFNFIKVDSSNNIWIGTDYYGLYSFDGINWKNTIKGLLNGGSFKPVVDLAVDTSGVVWAALYTSVAKFLGDTNWVYFDSSSIGLEIGRFSYDGLLIDKNNVKWFGNFNGLLRYDDINWSILNSSNSPIPANGFGSGFIDERNNKIYGLSEFPFNHYGLIFYNEDSVVITNINDNYSFEVNNYSLYQNYPNPFNPNTIISYQLPITSKVTIKLFDLLGREIQTLVNEEKSAGYHTLNFDGKNLPSGVYFYSLSVNDFRKTKKMVLMR